MKTGFAIYIAMLEYGLNENDVALGLKEVSSTFMIETKCYGVRYMY